jgi:hypothetical protein
MKFRVGQVIRYKGLVGAYVVADISLVRSDGVIGARKAGDQSGIRYEPIKRVDAA